MVQVSGGISLSRLRISGGVSGPTAPSGLTATADGGYPRVDLEWTDNSSDETGFKIERDSVQIATVGAGVTTYEDTGLTPGTTYAYRVRAYNDADDSSYSNVVSATVFSPSSIAAGSMPLWLKSDAGTYQDTGGVTPADDDGEAVGLWEDQSGNGNDVIQATAGNKPTYRTNVMNSLPVIRGDGGDYLRNATAATWKFMHDGTDWAIAVVFKTDVANPNAAYGLFGTNGASTGSIGASAWYDDRAGVPREDAMVNYITKGSSGNPIIEIITADDVVVAQQAAVYGLKYDNGATYADANTFRDGKPLRGGETQNTPHSAANPTYGLDILATGNAVLPITGDVAEVVVITDLAEHRNVMEYLIGRYAVTDRTNSGVGIGARAVDPNVAVYDAFAVGYNFAGALTWTFRRGTIHTPEAAADAYQHRSVDGGESYTTAIIFGDVTYDVRNYGGGIIPATGNGMWFCERLNVATTQTNDVVIRRSTDAGATWAYINVYSSGGSETRWVPYGPLVELPSGKLLQTLYGFDGAGNYRIWTIESTDAGASWGTETNIYSGTTYNNETAICYLSGDSDATSKLIAVARCEADGTKLRQFYSEDGGDTWSYAGELPDSTVGSGGQRDISPWLIVNDGKVHLIYADRTNMEIRYSSADLADVVDDVTAWSSPETVYSSALAAGSSNFGYPTVVIYEDGLVMAINDATGANDPDMYIDI